MVSSSPSSQAQPENTSQAKPSHPSDRKGEVIDGRYRILGLLGEGNSGTTHRAQRLSDGAVVALKEVSLQGSQSWKLIELFEREVAMLKQLDHPAIPRYVDSFVVDQKQDRLYYLAQTLAEGRTLTAWIESGWRCTEAEAQAVAIQLLEILSYLQRCDPPIIHRDIKPLNIIRSEDGQIFLVDFGAVGHTYHNTFMRGSTVVGTFGYMAPEQFRGQACTATDLYSLGATLLYLLTRRSPADLPAQQLKVDFRSKVLLSDGFADWLAQLIEPSLRHRFASAKVALTTLARLQQAESQDQGLLKPALKILTGLGLLGLAALFAINQYKYSVLKHLGTENELQAAIAAGDIPVAEYIARGGEVSLGQDQGQALLTFAVEQNDLNSIRVLLEQGVEPTLRNQTGTTPLHEAARHENIEILELLLEPSPDSDLDLNRRDRQGSTPLHLAATASHALRLMEAGAQPTLLNRQGKSILQNAVEQSWHPVVYQYLERTKGVPSAVPGTPSLLGIAAGNQDAKTVKMLVREGARFTRADLMTLDVEDLATAPYQESKRNWFMTGLPRLEGRDQDGKTLLHNAIVQRRWELGIFLIDLGAEVYNIDAEGNSAEEVFIHSVEEIYRDRLSHNYQNEWYWEEQGGRFYARLLERERELEAQYSSRERKQLAWDERKREQERRKQQREWEKQRGY